MTSTQFTRRTFLGSAAFGLTAIASQSSTTSAAEPSGEAFNFVQLCDTQLGFGGYQHDLNTFKQAVRQINAIQPDFVAICGDLVNTPNEKSYADFKKIKADLTVPCYCVAGNHDVGNQPTRKSLEEYRKVIGKDYYSFDHKGYAFVIVNTQLWKAPVEDESEKHDSWVEATLANATKRDSRIFIVGHYPFFLKDPDEDEEYMNLPRAKRKELLTLFERHGVVAVLGGHTHRLVINKHNNIQCVNGETTSNNFDQRPFGFRLWHVVAPRPFKHDFVPLQQQS